MNRILATLFLGGLLAIVVAGIPSGEARAAEEGEATNAPEGDLIYWLLRPRWWRATPEPPALPTLSDITHNSLTVAWEAPASGTFDIVDYDVQYGPAGTGAFTEWNHDGAATRATITDLAETTEYRVRVRAVNEMGKGDWSKALKGTTLAASVVFLEGSSTQRAVEENTPSGAPIGRPVAATTPAGPVRYELSGPDAGAFAMEPSTGQLRAPRGASYDHERRASYAVEIVARDRAGGTGRIAVHIDVLDVSEPPGRPPPPTVSASGSTQLLVDWTIPPNDGPVITDYDVEYRASGARTYQDARHVGRETRTTISALSPATQYEVRVRAFNDEGTGAWSETSRGETAGDGGDEPPDGPDLVVESAGVSASALDTGQSFTLSATVRNRGGAAAAATTLRWYRSADAAISSADAAAGTDAVSGLAASARSAESVGLTAPSSVGVYYYGACVDAVAGESDGANNCSGGVRVTVSEPPAEAPDLVVESAGVSGSSLDTGQSFTLSATVRNRGDAAAAATTLRWYRSADAAISSADAAAGTDAVSGLAASATSAESIALSAPANAGAYYYGACVDAVAGESDTANNCSGGVRVTVSEPPAPDLVVESAVSASSLDTGQSFTLSATVRNQGDGAAAATTLRWYRSADAAISSADAAAGTDAVSGLAASASSAESVALSAPASVGVYYYGACVDAVAGESDGANNCSGGVKVTVSEPPEGPDLVVESAGVSASSLDTGQSFTLSATVRNRGGTVAAATTLRWYRSTDAAISTADTAAGTDAVSGLAASASSAESVALSAPASAGVYYYGACVDAVAGESDGANNCSGGVKVTVSEPPDGPDLVVESAGVTASALDTGQSFTLSATVRNQGDAAAAATTLRWYRSADAGISTADTAAGTDAVSGLAASASSAESVALSAPASAGVYYYGACVDAVAGESDGANNCSGGVKVTVSEPPDGPDLVVESAGVTASALDTGQSFTLSATVRNRGDAAAAATTLRWYRSADAAISSADTAAGTDAVSGLAASASSAESVALSAPASAGVYYYGACVDAVAGESDGANNCSGGVKVTVSEPPDGPDLVVESVTANRTDLGTGQPFELKATVRNQGDAESAATTLRYYRSTDSGISSSDTQVGTDSVVPLFQLPLETERTTSDEIDLTAPNSVGTYYYGACVDSVAGESDTTNNCSTGIKFTISSKPVAPDLIVTNSRIKDNEREPGTGFIYSAFVENAGTGDSEATTARMYQSSDTNITRSDTELKTDSTIGALQPGRDTITGGVLTVPEKWGVYYYGACVDAVADETNTANNCSSAARLVVGGGSNAPDLLVESASVDNASLTFGDTFTLSATIRNRGDVAAASTTVRLYSYRRVIADVELWSASVAGLDPSDTSSVSVDVTVRLEPGTYHYRVCVDSVSGELAEQNNCSGIVEISVTSGG